MRSFFSLVLIGDHRVFLYSRTDVVMHGARKVIICVTLGPFLDMAAALWPITHAGRTSQGGG